MQSYRRIVSYLYRYTEEGKADNTGYVRVESRGNQIRLQFRIRDLKMMDARQLKFYLYFHKGEKLVPVYVDEFYCERGNCEYKKSYPAEGYDFEKMKGVLIYDNNGLLYGSSWDEMEIREEKITAEEEETKTEEPKAEEPEKTGRIEEVLEEMQTMEERNEPVMINELDQILSEYPAVVIEPAGEILRAVKISIEDIGKLPMANWNLVSNAFLQHAYEQYGYLLLGKLKWSEEKESFILGVPGRYDNREKYLANVFGFFDYISEEEGEFLTGKRGYWMIPVK